MNFDYIIIGAGSAGAVLAARLTEDKDVSVLLLEAGGKDRHPFQLMPLAFLRVGESRVYNWHYETEPEPAMNNRRLAIGRGKGLGGSSSINALICIRGHRRDYDRIAEMGMTGWGYADVLPYFKKLETNWRGETPYHGGNGPIRISPMEYKEMLYEPMREAAQALGIPHNDDPNGAVQEGISRMEATIGGGKRSSTAREYLYPVMDRPNLTVRTGALTLRIVIEKGRAVGVEYACGGQIYEDRVNREVLLSAGAYGSPQVLMLSGIGPADELKAMGIAPQHDLPGVGRNLSEHPNYTNFYRLREAKGLTQFLRLDRATAAVARWYVNHDGVFASNGAAANIFLRSSEVYDRPDVQLTPMSVSNSAGLWFPGFTAPPVHCFTIRIGVMHPASRGWVKLRSTDPRDKVRIQFNMYAEPEDMACMIRGMRKCRELFAQSPLREMIDNEVFPGTQRQSDEQLAEAVRKEGTHRSHPVGTCTMGTGNEAVVDAQLRVRGIEGLRVIDASVIPEVPGGNTNVPTIMIGEKAADMLRGRTLPRAELP
ncbi:MAG: GMC family oxidoreductase [Burkholderiales bacterium]